MNEPARQTIHPDHLCRETSFSLGVPVCSGLSQWLSSKESACNAGIPGDRGLIPASGRSPGGGNGNPLQCSWLENPMDREAWWATVHGVAKSWIRARKCAFTQLPSIPRSGMLLGRSRAETEGLEGHDPGESPGAGPGHRSTDCATLRGPKASPCL